MRYLFLLPLLTISCAATPPVAAVHSQELSSTTICRIVSRHHAIVVHAGALEPTYQLQSPDGRVLISDATLDQITKTDPRAARQIRSMQDGLLWAGTD